MNVPQLGFFEIARFATSHTSQRSHSRKSRSFGALNIVYLDLSPSDAWPSILWHVSAAESHVDFIKLGFGAALFTGKLENKS